MIYCGKSEFGQISRSFSLNSGAIRLKRSKNLTQIGFPSLRSVKSDRLLGIASAVLTLLILIFSEIIPKTMGAHYWRSLAPATAYGLKVLIWLLYPFVKLTEIMTRGMVDGPTLAGFSRQEFAAMAELSAEEGQLALRESEVLKNLLRLRDKRIKDAMTPRIVVFSVPAALTVGAFFEKHEAANFSRIPVYRQDPERLEGFVLRGDLLLARANNELSIRLESLQRPLPILPESLSLAKAFNQFMKTRAHIVQAVDEYGSLAGILTLEDVLETLLGMEIVDEGDQTVDMRDHARRLWSRRRKAMGIEAEDDRRGD